MTYTNFNKANDYLIREDEVNTLQIRLFDKANSNCLYLNLTDEQEESLRQWLNRRHENKN